VKNQKLRTFKTMKAIRPLKSKKKHLIAAGTCLGIVLGGAGKVQAQSQGQADPSVNDGDKISQLEKENQDLQKRLAKLENLAEKEGLMTSGATNADPPVSAMSEISISGFVTTSIVHDTSGPKSVNGYNIPGYLWDRQNDAFTLNKVKLTLASPQVQNNGDKFDAGYRVSFIAGQDAPFVDTSSAGAPSQFNYIREAFIEMNIPIGTGLDVKAGELISLLNYESGDGGAVNNNMSQGFQWFFTGNPPEEGVQLGYNFTDQVGLTVRAMNSMFGGEFDSTTTKAFMGSLNLKPCKDLWVNLLGFVEPNKNAGVSEMWGASILAGYQLTPALSLGTELDWWNLYDSASVAPVAKVYGDNHVYSGGLWVAYDFSKQFTLALRTEFLSDDHGIETGFNGVSGGLVGLQNPVGTGQDITSVALTLNYKPNSHVKIQPEARFDHTSWSHGWDPITTGAIIGNSKQNRFLFGMAASYLF
jgi:hypothetical protein